MNIRLIFISVLSLFCGFISEANPSEIEWNLYLKPYMNLGPVLSKTTQEGQQFTIENLNLTGAQSQSGDLLNDLEGTTFLVQQSPVNKPIEIRIILNVRDDSFEKAGTVPTFLNITFEIYIGGRQEDPFSFSSGSPLIMNIPKGIGLDNLLDRCNFKRSDNILFVYYDGGKFDKEGIGTYNQISGLKAHIDRSATVLGGLGDDFGYPQNFQFSPWHKIKELFR